MNHRFSYLDIYSHILFCVVAFSIVFTFEAAANVLAKDYSSVFNKARAYQTQRVIDIGDSLLDKGLSDNALVYYMVACNRAARNLSDEERRLVAIAHLRKGNVYYLKGGYATALRSYIDGIKICEEIPGQKELGRFYNNVGNIYCMFHEYEKGISYYKKAREFNHKCGDRANEHKNLVNLTGVCLFLGKTKEAFRYYDDSEALKDTADVNNNFMSRFNYSLIFLADNNSAKAAAIMKECIGYGKKNNVTPEYLCSAYTQLYRNYLKMGQRDSAIVYMRMCLNDMQQNGLSHKFADVLKDYAEICHENGDISKAYNLRSQYLEIMDSVYNMKEFDMVKNSQFIYEMDKTDKQIAQLHANEEEHLRSISHQRIVIAGIIGVLLVVGFLLGMVWRQKKLLNRSYNDLYAVNRDFAATLESMKNKETAPEQPAMPTRRNGLDSEKMHTLAVAIADVMKNPGVFCSPDFSLDRMAELVNSNSRYVSQVINDTFNKNFSNYVNEYRIRLACLRLSDTGAYGNYTLKGIGESVGFRSYTTFVTVFRKITGITPKLYQEKASEESARHPSIQSDDESDEEA